MGNSQGRGNSGIFLMGLYEIQVLDSFNNKTYADGQAAAIYGQWPPLANAARKSGEWQAYDIVFEAPRFEGDKLVKPAFQTVFWNGVVVHNRKEVMWRDDLSQRREVHAARRGIAADDPGPRESGEVPQHLGSPPGNLRSAGEVARFARS